MKQTTNDVLVLLSIVCMFTGFLGAVILFLMETAKTVFQQEYAPDFTVAIVSLVVCIAGSVGLVLLGVKPTKEGQ